LTKCKNAERRLDEKYTGKVEAQECPEADSLLVLNAFCFSDFF